MQKEIWKDVPGYEGYYQISNLGITKSLTRFIQNPRGTGTRMVAPRILKYKTDKCGYKHVHLNKNGIGKTFLIHQLIAIIFLNHIPDGNKMVVDHIDNNPSNNHIDNLQIITQRENCSKDKFRSGSTSKYIGVSLRKSANKWCAAIRINKKSVHLGYFDNELDAAKAYQDKLKEIT